MNDLRPNYVETTLTEHNFGLGPGTLTITSIIIHMKIKVHNEQVTGIGR